MKIINDQTDDDDPDTRQTPKGQGNYRNNKASSKQLDFVTNLLKAKVNEKHSFESLHAGIKKRLNTDENMENWTGAQADRKSTRLNSSHVAISYAVFCLKKKTVQDNTTVPIR